MELIEFLSKPTILGLDLTEFVIPIFELILSMFFKHVLSVPSLSSLSCFLSESTETGPSSSEVPLKSIRLLMVYLF